jgi:cysteinyl-tRNA synthetase
MQIKLFNTESREKEVLNPLEDHHVKMYTCGPTVYNYAHIGNFRTYVFEDLLRRTIQFFGLKITQVMNLTDVDDKTIKGAIQQNVSLDEYTLPYKEAFFNDVRTLGIEPAEHYPAATEYINEMIDVIQVLLDKGFAYKGNDGSIYYSIHQFPKYGCLSHLNLSDLKAGASERVASDEYDKEHIADFVLWKKYDPQRDGKIYWESPYGKGRPGWHLECSVMAMKILGPTIDIHVGGIDNMFPHHENEIAQSEAYSEKPFVKIWMHSEHLVVDNKKMSKSLGNFYTLRDLLNKGYTGPQIRYMLLQTHYKTQLNFTFEGLEAVKNSLQRLNDFIQRLYEVENSSSQNSIEPLINKALQNFSQALADDLNISVALAAVFELMHEVNGRRDKNALSREEAQQIIDCLKKMDRVLGFLSFEKQVEEVPQELQNALERRIQARKDRNWALADELRDFITNRGYTIEDTANGQRLKKTN